MGFLTLLLPGWLDDSILRALRKQDFVSVEFFRLESRLLKQIVTVSVILLGGLSWFLTGRFIFALSLLVFLPWFLFVFTSKRQIRIKERMGHDFVANLYALKGLLDVGSPFPQALYLISQESSTHLSFLLNRIIHGFQLGKSLENNFKNLENRNPGEWVLQSLKFLEKAYRRGLALSPLVESLIEVVELENQVNERLRRLQRDLWVQALFASVIPWLLGLVCWMFQPEIMKAAFTCWEGKFILIFVLFWEGIGIWVLRQAIRFY